MTFIEQVEETYRIWKITPDIHTCDWVDRLNYIRQSLTWYTDRWTTITLQTAVLETETWSDEPIQKKRKNDETPCANKYYNWKIAVF